MLRWLALSLGLPAGTIAYANFGVPGSSPLTDGDVVLLVVLALTNAGMFAAASMAWRFPLTRTSTIDDLLRLCPDRGSIVGVIAQGYRWQFVLPLVAAAIPIVLHLHSGDVGSLRAQILAANLAWTMFLFGNVSWWLIVPPLVAIKLRSCRHVNLRWNDPARTPGIRTLAEGYAYPALFLALAAFAVALPGLMGYEHLLGRVQPYLYGWLLVLSLWVGAVTQLSIFLIVRRFRLRMMDTLAPGNEYNISEEQVNAIFARVQRQIESTAALSAYNSVAAAPGLPYGTGLIVQYVATVVGSVASFLLQWLSLSEWSKEVTGQSDDLAQHRDRVTRYYHRTESKVGYKVFLHGTKHFGWYEPGQSKWQFRAAMRRMEDELARRLALPEGSKVLDAGCGMGDVARTMAGKHKLVVTGIDILDFNIEEAKRRSQLAGLEDETVFMQGDYHALDFADGSFDGVYTMETFVHAADPERVLSEFHRVLKPGGRLVMFEYSRTPAAELDKRANEALRLVCELAAMPTWYRLNHGELEKLLDAAGFVVDSVEDVTKRMLPMLHAFYILGWFPYFVGRISGRVPKVVNAMSGVEMWRHQAAWRYNIYVAHKKE